MSGGIPNDVRKVDLHQMQDFASTIKVDRPTSGPKDIPIVPKTKQEAVDTLNPSEVFDAEPMFCMEPFRVAYIKRDGNVSPCCLWPNRTQSFGNLASMTAPEIWNGPAFEVTRDSIVGQKAYPDGCKYCAKSKIAPQDAQLWQAQSFIDWYNQGYGVDLSDSFDSGHFASARSFVEGLACKQKDIVSRQLRLARWLCKKLAIAR